MKVCLILCFLNALTSSKKKFAQTYKKMLEQPRKMGRMTLNDLTSMSLWCQMRTN